MGYVKFRGRNWPIPPFRDTQIIGFHVAALHQIAERHSVESPIAVRGQKETLAGPTCWIDFGFTLALNSDPI